MNREIKFEILIKHKSSGNTFKSVFTIDELFYHSGIQEVVYKRQFTGLKDSKGVEIYEGDIVTCNIYEREVFDEHYSGTPLKVVYDENSCGFYPFIKGSQWRSNIENVEVIGNIFEHPNLLTDKAN